uniref:Uncharacterized protein n=1 Tax=Apteryx owenii TaxID=8824 RepID=A0A8B9P851_APTOW
ACRQSRPGSAAPWAQALSTTRGSSARTAQRRPSAPTCLSGQNPKLWGRERGPLPWARRNPGPRPLALWMQPGRHPRLSGGCRRLLFSSYLQRAAAKCKALVNSTKRRHDGGS